jgi:hypothetical protein
MEKKSDMSFFHGSGSLTLLEYKTALKYFSKILKIDVAFI